MQRVLSFQMVRGVNESREFVTKRMCFSFILSIGFLTFLGGYTLGRFVMIRAMEFRAEKRRLELAGNGLENTEHLQRFMLKQLERASLDPDFEMKWDSFNLKEDDIYQVNNILSNLSLIEKVVKCQSHIVATARGAREPDRYVVLSASGEGVGIALKLAKIFNQIQEECTWKPRRSIIFCLFSASSNPCPEILSSFLPHKIVAYIVVDHQALQGKGHFIVSGSDIVQFMVLESASIVKDWFSYDNQLLSSNNTFYNVTTSRLALDIPHAVLSYVNNNITCNEDHHERELHKIILAQIVGQTIWKFSESLIIKWNPSYFNNTALDILKSINNTELLDVKEKVQQTLDKLLTSIKICNKKIDTVDNINTLDTRILNDLMMDLDRILLCPDKQNQSRTDWSKFFRLNHKPSDKIIMYMNEVVKCYENAIQFLQDR
ncbi:transferrin receptor protein 1 [Bombus vosnesenskii]|uniref:Transferrin receptor protein 1 n=1 Tax=Bombus vosnesenskii TaxID=207650 RepID=A0A6J3JVN1_9HYME|nr:transferrin receptor protein 1 [Bombus vosnesenskii]